MEFRDTFHASLGIDLTIQFFRKRIGNCFLYDCLEQRRVGFLNKRGVSKMLPTVTFLHFPCTHASKERCRKHSGYLGCTLLRPFSFLRLHLVTLLCSWLILKLQERDKWVVGACGDILYQLPISLCLCVISIAQLLDHWRSVFVFLLFVFLFILILQGTSSVSAQLLNR